MRGLTRFTSSVTALSCALLTLTTPHASGQVAIESIGSLGGSYSIVYALGDDGALAGASFTAGDAEQHAFLYRDRAMLDLGTLGGSSSCAFALNSRHQVVGMASITDDQASRPFLFVDGPLTDLGSLGGRMSSAIAINSSGLIVGDSFLSGDVDRRAFLASGEAMTELGTLGGSFSYANALSERGHVTGQAALANGEAHAFRFFKGAMEDLGTLGGTSSLGRDVNTSGWVTGEAWTGDDLEVHAFLHNGAQMIDLGTLGGSFSTAYSLNEAGAVIGDASTAGDLETHAFLHDGAGLIDLGTLGGPYSTPYALNNRGQVVGESLDALSLSRAFLWENQRMTDLNSLLPPDSGWDLYSARFINDAGQIAGYGIHQGNFEWFLLSLTRSQPNRPPVAEAGLSQTVEAVGQQTVVRLDGTRSSDPDGEALTYQWSEGGLLLGQGPVLDLALAMGQHLITLKVVDPDSAWAEDHVLVSVQDTTAPQIQGAIASPDLLSPANGKMVDVTLSILTNDACDPAPSSQIIAVQGTDGTTRADWAITGPLTASLRAKTSSPKTERIYTLTVQCTDYSGNSSLKAVTVRVPAKGKTKGSL